MQNKICNGKGSIHFPLPYSKRKYHEHDIDTFETRFFGLKPMMNMGTQAHKRKE